MHYDRKSTARQCASISAHQTVHINSSAPTWIIQLHRNTKSPYSYWTFCEKVNELRWNCRTGYDESMHRLETDRCRSQRSTCKRKPNNHFVLAFGRSWRLCRWSGPCILLARCLSVELSVVIGGTCVVVGAGCCVAWGISFAPPYLTAFVFFLSLPTSVVLTAAAFSDVEGSLSFLVSVGIWLSMTAGFGFLLSLSRNDL